ncbi:MAG: hypothetical protein P1U56_23230 [Saprospiraceae bacterium]|nr:hypothetical protein [Saprospiraceae bacterium]
MSRDNDLVKLRPVLQITAHEKTSSAEKFQNDVLRPILKFQNDLLCLMFLHTPFVIKKDFSKKHEDQKRSIISDVLKTDQKLKQEIIHCITSLMTIDEYNHFLESKSEYSKRIISMAIQRLKDGLTKNF